MDDLKSQSDCVALLNGCKSETDWNSLCTKIKHANGGPYPGWWYRAVIMSGLAGKVSQDWAVSP